MNTFKKEATIISVDKLTADICSMWIHEEEIALVAKPGQFLSLYCKNGERILPRPISICEIDKEHNYIRFVYRLIGKGTEEIAQYLPKEKISVMGPLGNGFPMLGKKVILIGGGIGIPPMLELAKQFHGEKEIVLGYRDELFLNTEFEAYGNVYISTEDGSTGTRGNVIDAIREHQLQGDTIFACGPTPMLRGIKEYAKEQGITAYLSMEERMACGIGACLACVCKTKEKNHHTHVNNTRVCKDGPVFLANEIEL